LQGKTILVTGGAGFIGSHFSLTQAIRSRVVVFDNFASAVVTPTELKAGGVSRVITGDILDMKRLASAMKGVDVVFHFAVACIRLSLSNEQYVHEVNATGTLNTLLAAKKAGVKRFVYISSSEAYGSAQKPRISETHPMNPTTVYGMSKYHGELYTKLFNDHQGLPGMVVRPFNTYGPRSHFEGVYGEVIPRFVIRALNGKQPLIFGTGRQTRDFTYVTDTVEGIALASQEDALLGQVVNVARGQEVTIGDIAKHICALTGISHSPIRMPERPNDLMRHYADITKAKKLLSFAPKIPIAQGLAAYIAWVKQTYPNPKKLLTQIPATNW
jgi:UDP-glucose 4-epimerase